MRSTFARAGAGLLALPVLMALVLAGACSGDGQSALDDGDTSGSSLSARTELRASGVLFQPPRPAADFTLTGTDGEPVSLSDFEGKVVALYFGYTHCPDICPLTLGTYQTALSKLPESVSEDVQVVLVSVDPERDTPEVLGRYLSLFDEDYAGLTGSPEEIDAVLAKWGIEVARSTPDENGGYEVEHPADSWIVDREGRLRLKVSHMTGSDALAADLKTIVEEGQQ